jgi:hypothetical protein
MHRQDKATGGMQESTVEIEIDSAAEKLEVPARTQAKCATSREYRTTDMGHLYLRVS